MKFELTDEQTDAYIIWQRDHECSKEQYRTKGGAVTFQFTPSGLGVVESVKCICGSRINLTDYDKW